MNNSQHPFVRHAIPLMKLAANERVLELGCGDGWACRELARHVSTGLVIGLDALNDYIREARAKSTEFENILYLWAEAEQIPWQEDFFTHVVCVDSVDSFRDHSKVLREAGRVLAQNGMLWIVNRTSGGDSSEEDARPHVIPAAKRGALQCADYLTIAREIGYEDCVDRSPTTESGLTGEGSVWLLSARKPNR